MVFLLQPFRLFAPAGPQVAHAKFGPHPTPAAIGCLRCSNSALPELRRMLSQRFTGPNGPMSDLFPLAGSSQRISRRCLKPAKTYNPRPPMQTRNGNPSLRIRTKVLPISADLEGSNKINKWLGPHQAPSQASPQHVYSGFAHP